MSASERIAQIRAREWAATKGPWKYEDDRGRGRLFHWVKDDEYNESGQEWEMLNYGREAPFYSGDARFIAEARQDVPWLLQRLERAEALLRDAMITGSPGMPILWDVTSDRIEAFLSESTTNSTEGSESNGK